MRSYAYVTKHDTVVNAGYVPPQPGRRSRMGGLYEEDGSVTPEGVAFKFVTY